MPPSNDDIWTILDQRERKRVLQRLSHAYAAGEQSPADAFYSVTKSKKHRADNRYSNVLAYDRTAIHPADGPYLNANVVTDGRQWWVASQAPTPSTFPAFFQAMYDQTASRHPLVQAATDGKPLPKRAILVQLTGWEENGQPKADKYLLPGTHGTLKLEVDKPVWREELQADTRRMMLDDMEVTHYHFEGWPDFGVPKGAAVEALRRLVLEVEKVREGEVWVHCSAGVGRTGTFIALSSLLVDHSHLPPIRIDPSPLGPLEDELREDRVAKTVDGIREYRGMMVQQPPQLELLYKMGER